MALWPPPRANLLSSRGGPGALRAPPASATWPGTQGTTLGRPPRQGPAGCPLRRRDHRRCSPRRDRDAVRVARRSARRGVHRRSTAQSTARRARPPPPSSRTTCASSRSPLCPVIGARRSPSPGFLSFLGGISYQIRILLYRDVSCMYPACIL